MAPSVLGLFVLCALGKSATIELLECNPPDYPQWGGYGPRQDFYLPGDVIHYYCDAETYIGGNFYRRCEDNGDWTGDTPVCDNPARFVSTRQSSTASPEDDNGADLAADGSRTTCSSTLAGEGSTWSANLTTPGILFRVMLFLPKGDVNYEVLMVKGNGTELSCGRKQARIDRYEWEFHNCPGPNNVDIVGIKVRSYSQGPLEICEAVAHSLTDPSCTDPHLAVENGRFQLSRKVASLVCDKRYTRSPTSRVECIRNGVWNRKTLYCLEPQWEHENNDFEGNDSEREPQTNERPRENPERLASSVNREV